MCKCLIQTSKVLKVIFALLTSFEVENGDDYIDIISVKELRANKPLIKSNENLNILMKINDEIILFIHLVFQLHHLILTYLFQSYI
jgi:hypothetical protein